MEQAAMDTLWPWLAVAGIGALHGLNPAAGWMLAAALGVRTHERSQALRALVPIALGHVASVGLVAGAVALGVPMDRGALRVCAGVLFALLLLVHLWHRTPRRVRTPAGHAGLALWSFMVSSAHGAGLMLVPAMLPLCLGTAGQAPGEGALAPLVLALAALAVHMAAMLAVTGALAFGACRGVEAGWRLWRSPERNPPGAASAQGAATRRSPHSTRA